MRLPFLPFLILWFASGRAQLCSSSREFAVDNCTACPTLDHTRGDVRMADCQERAAGTGVGIAYACVCLDFPDAEALVYYPHVEGNTTRCASSWGTAPQLYTALVVVCGCVQLYAAAHLMYIVVLTGMCSCKQHRCTKINASALLMCMFSLCWLSIFLWWIAAHGEGDIGNAWLGYDLVYTITLVALDLAQVLLYTSVCDMIFSGDDVAGWRRGINITFWTLVSASALLHAVTVIGHLVGADPSWTTPATNIGRYLRVLAFLYSSVFMVIAHCRMNAAVRKHSAQPTKPAFVIKMDSLSDAICRYYYALLILYLVSNMLAFAIRGCPDNSAMPPMVYWILRIQLGISTSVCIELYACILEGKRVPTFPGCLCRRGPQSQSLTPKVFSLRPLSGLQFNSTLGKALALLTKHGLDTERRKEFPVEVAMESLLSTSSLMVAAAPDMDVMSCVEHLLEQCVDDEGEIAPKFAQMSVTTLVRGGWNQHILTAADIPQLRGTAMKCLQWAQDPARPAIGNTTVDEAAAIQLYTQHSCLYPMLNGALRDHAHPENLEAFSPYLKLLLKGLNKLPLLRTKVYRGVNVDLHEEYNQLQGRTFRWWAFSSTTQRESQAQAFLGKTGESTLFKIDGIGVDIAAFSAFPNESEVLLLPGTCLVVEPGVMVEDNRWEFQASVWDAAQQQLQQRQQHSEVNNEGGAEETPASPFPDRDDSGEPMQHFQYTDLPHPGWEQLVYPVPESPPGPSYK